MKKIFYLLLILIAAVSLFSCEGEMDSTYKQFVVPNGINYPQRVDDVEIVFGENRVKLTWSKPIDPKVVKTMVFWNNYADTLLVNVPAEGQTVTCIVNNLPEGNYTFQVKTFDSEGNASISNDISGKVFGANYRVGLTARTVKSAMLTEIDGTEGFIDCGSATLDLIFTEIRYKNNSNETITRQLPSSAINVTLPDVKRGEFFEFRSVFYPKNALDTFYLAWEQHDPFLNKVAKTGWSATADSYLDNWGDGKGGSPRGGLPINTIDNDITSGWHSATSTNFDAGTNKNLNALPHWVIVNMVGVQDLRYVELYLHNSYRYARTVRVYVADSPARSDWEKPENLTVEFEFPTATANNTLAKFTNPKQGQYLIIFFPNSGSGVYSNLFEITGFGW
ncbi:MAG: DUF4998 domain-containing protein [Prevotellaceae bacterium]|jgi:hypothetical protein|nr:DUF4998 domain-containing protein [Prevotellaceae bacterium]